MTCADGDGISKVGGEELKMTGAGERSLGFDSGSLLFL